MILKLQSTDRMSNVLNCILDWVSKIVHRVDAPLISSIMMSQMSHTIDNRISHIHVRGSHVNLCTKYLLSVCILAVFHLLKQLQIFLYASVAIWALLTWFSQGSSVLANLLCCQITNKCLSLLNQEYGILIHLIKII